MEKVRYVAEWTRKWAEKACTDKEIKMPNDLTGMCAICSYVIAHGLIRFNIPYKFVINYHACGSHVYIEVNKHIVDVTATQFDVNDKVIVKQIKKNENDYFWFNDRHRFTLDWFEDEISEWCIEQQPYGEEGSLKKVVNKGIDNLLKEINKVLTSENT